MGGDGQRMSRFRMPSRGRTNKQNPSTRTSRGGRPPDPRERSRRPRVARFVDAEGCEQRGAVRVASSPHSSSVRSIMENVSSHLLWSSRQHPNRKPSRPIKMRHRPRSVTETPFSVFFWSSRVLCFLVTRETFSGHTRSPRHGVPRLRRRRVENTLDAPRGGHRRPGRGARCVLSRTRPRFPPTR